MPRRVCMTFAMLLIANSLLLRVFADPPQRATVAYTPESDVAAVH